MRLYFRLFCAYRFVLSLLHTMNKFACHCSHLYSSLQWQDPMWRRGKLIWLVDNDQKWTVILLYIKTTVPPKCIYWYTFWQNIFKREVLLKTSNDFLNKSSKYSIIFPFPWLLTMILLTGSKYKKEKREGQKWNWTSSRAMAVSTRVGLY